MASARQVAANRENGLKGGVKTEEGKAVSRLNARKHSIFVTALTPEDSEEICGYEDELIASLRPVGRMEEMLVEKIALTWLRIQRCARAEAEYHSQTWEEPNEKWEWDAWHRLQTRRERGMRAVAFKSEVFERTIKLIDLYDNRLTNQLLKLMHEIERMQLLRKGKDAPTDVADPPPSAQNDAPPLTEAIAAAPELPPAVDDVGAESASQPPSAVVDGLPAESQPRSKSGTVPHTGEAPAAEIERVQDSVRKEDMAQTPV